ncbi:MAG: hypothetical protein ACTHJR_18585 [Sphingomonas sp.]|uniref:hypothetical protein n=1 Tax=Sphingomonas sp. TaxID=28214 RepID=UPI003F8110B5
MRIWLLTVSALALVPAAAGEATMRPSAADLLANIPICGDDLPVGATPRLYPGYGGGGFPIATANPQAQAFFDNGMQLAHAFAHHAASAAFAEAVKLDPDCAMCQWGAAWSDGPTINFGIGADQQKTALAKVVAAEKLLTPRSPQRERDLIAALKLRYVDGGGKGSGDRAFAKAMDALAIRYPQDDEIATIAADAWMIPTALTSGTANLPRAVALLEGVLKRNPDYTPAIHFYIHATEMSGFPKRAEPYADKLGRLAPASSHLIHMPSHTFYWVGRYQDAADANVSAVALGEGDARIAGLEQPGQIWMLPYHAHNVQYGVGGALISGDGKAALALSDPLVAATASLPDPNNLFVQMGVGTGYFAEGRFADPVKVMALPDPGDKQPYIRQYWRYARGEAQARLGNAAGVRAELAKISLPALPAKPDDLAKQAHQLVRIAQLVLEGRAAMIEKRPDLAARAYLAAAKLDEARLMKTLSDPPAWWYPVRRSYAAALLAQGKARAAVKQASLVLARRDADPVALTIRADAEEALGQKDAAARDRTAAARGWRGDKAELTLPLA